MYVVQVQRVLERVEGLKIWQTLHSSIPMWSKMKNGTFQVMHDSRKDQATT
jgi:hypothetical protein